MTPENRTEETIYTINIKSRFILTQTQIKKALGIGFQVLSVELAKDASNYNSFDDSSAAKAIVQTGFRALARAYHPDSGGDPEKFRILNKTKQELIELLNNLGE